MKTELGVKAIMLAALATACLVGVSFSQTAYSADGYHGGVYGHYPDWTTAFMVDGKSLLLRLFNAEGDGAPKHLRFDGRVAKAQLVELNGESRSLLSVTPENSGKTSVTLAIPRFGIRTLRLDGVGVVAPE